ncbi:Type I secretion system ATP-binding protein PrsD [Methylobrevis pamukkalensis]|uniref:Type I secretion system ATP-binding protein PrsD n=2 Tax=Methylobrevis pamukkalensis TaxID=1439726 RepID=A0A1E3GNQ6_9HYPH|nr:Type I secretion system ATP-binding protein PrsD [Methylobrevis pamukkalensis]
MSSFRSAMIGTGVMSGMINILALTGSFFMLQVYDRVIPSRSLSTLVGLVILAGALYAFMGLLEILRGRVLLRIGIALDGRLNGEVCSAMMRLPLKTRSQGDGQQPLRDLDQVRSFLSGGGPSALFDMPWMPLYLAICFVFHLWIGLVALAGAVILVILTILTEILTREPMREAGKHSVGRNGLAEAARRNAEVVQAMGFGPRLASRWADATPTISTPTPRPAASPACSAAFPRSCAWRCSRACSRSALSRRAAGSLGRHHDRQLDHDGPRAGAIELAIGQWKGFVAPARAGSG